ncbi:MAG: sodium/proton-translocating pyrophosphatase, partial [Candidatus Sumerlaeota bacterium]|nr:sodium/proton-translocating pyrophosphatase [Candidatus Sumerlaeota bacterium]
MCNRNGGKNLWLTALGAMAWLALSGAAAFAGEADINLPDLTKVTFNIFGSQVGGLHLLYGGLVVCAIGAIFGLIQYSQIKNLPVHESMGAVSETIWETCKTYLFQQGKFLAMLWVLIGACIIFYFGKLQAKSFGDVLLILVCSIVGILGSYGVAWFGIRINTKANSRSAFSALKGSPLEPLMIPMKSGMSVGLLLVSVELFFMIIILAFLPPALVGACFIGFAIGESLGASALRIAGGIFTKIADIGSDLMKIVFHLPEDDPKNPGVIADCTGDNAGDSVGPTADGFETYGVTGVALIAFLALALAAKPAECGHLIIWIFVMRILMIITSLVSYYLNEVFTVGKYSKSKSF